MIGYILGFFMAFIILVTTLYAFGLVNETARELSANAQARDVANRVALAVQDTFAVASSRNDTYPTISSSGIRFNRTLTVPDTIQGWNYEVRLDANFVNATVISPSVTAGVPTFNAAVSLPATPAQCSVEHVVCSLSGTVAGGFGRIIVSYHFDRDAAPVTSAITLQSPSVG